MFISLYLRNMDKKIVLLINRSAELSIHKIIRRK